jgi:hypothetical protein
LAIAEEGRYLTFSNGSPHPLLVRTLWCITSLPQADYRALIDDTSARGFTAFEFCLNHFPANEETPFDGNGYAPFSHRLDGVEWDGSLDYDDINVEAPDFTRPTAAHWAVVDDIIKYAASRRLMVLFFPAYVGVSVGLDGWRAEMVANGAARMRSYGAWIAARYQITPNLVWMLGGDCGIGCQFSDEENAVEQAMIDGMLSVAGQLSTLFSNEWFGDSIGTDQPLFGRYINLNGCYSFEGRTASVCRRAYAHTPAIPAFLQEGPFDEEGPEVAGVNPASTQPIRRYSWWAWLSAIAGYTFGNGFVWSMNAGYAAHLDSEQTRHHAILNQFIRSIEWWTLVPEGLGQIGTLVTAGAGIIDTTGYVAAAASPAGTLLVAYLGPAHADTVTIDMSAMRGPATARWFDPTSGSYREIGIFPNSAEQRFAPPGFNAAGDQDWVLILTG